MISALRVAVALAGSLLTVAPVVAHEYEVGAMRIDHPWSRQTPPGARVGAGYVTITNTGTEPDRLIGGNAAISDGFEIHSSATENGVARMRRLAEGIAIAPGETMTLAPMGTHVMLTGLRAPIAAGQLFEGTFVFERAGSVAVSFRAEPLGGSPAVPAAGTAPAAQGHEGHGG